MFVLSICWSKKSKLTKFMSIDRPWALVLTDMVDFGCQWVSESEPIDVHAAMTEIMLASLASCIACGNLIRRNENSAAIAARHLVYAWVGIANSLLQYVAVCATRTFDTKIEVAHLCTWVRSSTSRNRELLPTSVANQSIALVDMDNAISGSSLLARSSWEEFDYMLVGALQVLDI